MVSYNKYIIQTFLMVFVFPNDLVSCVFCHSNKYPRNGSEKMLPKLSNVKTLNTSPNPLVSETFLIPSASQKMLFSKNVSNSLHNKSIFEKNSSRYKNLKISPLLQNFSNSSDQPKQSKEPEEIYKTTSSFAVVTFIFWITLFSVLLILICRTMYLIRTDRTTNFDAEWALCDFIFFSKIRYCKL